MPRLARYYFLPFFGFSTWGFLSFFAVTAFRTIT